MKYRYLLIDNDNTLMDFHAAEHAALRETLTEAGIEPTDAVCARYSATRNITSPPFPPSPPSGPPFGTYFSRRNDT